MTKSCDHRRAPLAWLLVSFAAPYALLGATSAAHGADSKKPQPNIVILLADDLGYGDLGCFGNSLVITPHLDQLAQQGVRLTNFYADAPVCSPTRASLLTGQLPQRHGITGVIATGDRETGLTAQQPLLPVLLQKLGYRTALFGKWHLGSAVPNHPIRCGFDRFFGGLMGGLDFFTHETTGGRHDLWQDETQIHRDGRYITDLMAEQAEQFIDANRQRPFFLFVSFHAVHTSMGGQSPGTIQAPTRWLDRYQHNGSLQADSPERLKMAACISAMDEAAGRVLDSLQRNQLDRNTLVFFTSDNGPLLGAGGSAGALRGGKHSLWEGGIRVPAIVRWPAKMPAGAVCDQPETTRDLLPTLFAALGESPPSDMKLDGQSLLADWARVSPQAIASSPRTLYWSYVRDSNNTRERAVRRSSWKWLNGELYNLQSDPGETTNVAAKYSDIARELETAWNHWLAEFPVEAKRWDGRDSQRQTIQRRPATSKSS